MKYAFYPGCSLEFSAVAYGKSIFATAKALGIDLVEVDDWNCCGATEYWTTEKMAALAVIARNLALVDPSADGLTAPCAACYLNLRKADKLMVEHPALAAKVNDALGAGGLSYTPGRLRIMHLLELLFSDVGEEKIRAMVKRPLKGLRVAPYYGCQVVRPYADFDNPEYPVKLDEMLGWIGAEVVDYPVKAHCCGGHLTLISEDQAFELIRRLLQNAADYKTDVIACMCPMCQLNLDAYQGKVNGHFGTDFNLPSLYFTQLLGLAFGLPEEELGIGKEIVAAQPVLSDRLHAVAQGETK